MYVSLTLDFSWRGVPPAVRHLPRMPPSACTLPVPILPCLTYRYHPLPPACAGDHEQLGGAPAVGPPNAVCRTRRHHHRTRLSRPAPVARLPLRLHLLPPAARSGERCLLLVLPCLLPFLLIDLLAGLLPACAVLSCSLHLLQSMHPASVLQLHRG